MIFCLPLRAFRPRKYPRRCPTFHKFIDKKAEKSGINKIDKDEIDIRQAREILKQQA